jgi:hypothetical protein
MATGLMSLSASTAISTCTIWLVLSRSMEA